MKHTVQQTLKKIKDYVSCDTHILQKESQLYYGSCGKILFLVLYYKAYKDKSALNSAIKLLDPIVENFEKTVESSFLSNGYSGTLWLLQYLVNKNYLDEEEILDIGEATKGIIEMIDNHHNLKYDLMYGVLGYGVFFIERHKYLDCTKELSSILDFLERTCVEEKGKIYWTDTAEEYEVATHDGKVINMGLAHGVPSIISFLADLSEFEIFKERANFLINGAIKWIMSIAQKSSEFSFYHVYDTNLTPLEDWDNSKLAWTYGDLSVAYSIAKAVKVTCSDEHLFFVKQVIEKTYTRNLEQSNIWFKPIMNGIDASFSNGTAGIAHLYSGLAILLGLNPLIERQEYWIKKTIDASLEEKRRGIYGYVSYGFNEDHILTTTEIDTSLFNGISGIGIVLLEYLFPKLREEDNWSSIFLTNL